MSKTHQQDQAPLHGLVRESVPTDAVIGRWWDHVVRRDPVTGREYIAERGEVIKKNLIVERCLILLAGLMRNDTDFTGGILFHAQGQGSTLWDTALPTPAFTQITLVDETFRSVPDSILYVDSTGTPTTTKTRSILVQTTLDFTHPLNGSVIREQGLFGGNAGATKDSGFMVDAIIHLRRDKDVSVKIIRFIQLDF